MKIAKNIIILLTIMCILFNTMETSTIPNQEKSIFRWGREVFAPLIGDNTFYINNNDDAFQEGTKDYISYWIQGSAVMGLLCSAHYDNDGDSLIKAQEIIANLMETYYTHGYFPRPKYEKFDYGWVSSMDAPAVLLASQMAYEITGDVKYKKFRDDLKTIIIKDVKEKGFIFDDDNNNLWMFEYADKETNPETGFYVLNGSLVAYQSLYMVGSTIEDYDYLNLCEKQLKSYKNIAHKYWYKDRAWSYYMLNPKDINPPHYMIFEKKLFEVIYKVNKDPFFYYEAMERENALKTILPLYLSKGEGDSEDKFYLLRASAPHPYILDIYNTELEILDANKDIIPTFYEHRTGTMNKEEFEKGMFMYGTLDKDAAYYRLYSTSGKNGRYMLFESKIKDAPLSNNEPLKNSISVSGDLKEKDRILHLNKNNSDDNKGIITINLEQALLKKPEAYIGIEIDISKGTKIPVSIIFYDSNNKAISRYYTPIVEGKNLILLSYMGFIDNENIQDISTIMVRLHSNELGENEDIFMEVNNIYSYSNSVELYEYLNISEYKVNPQ